MKHMSHSVQASTTGLKSALATCRVRRSWTSSMRSNRRGKESQRLKQRRQPWQMSNTRRSSASSLVGVVEIRVLPGDRMAGRRVETAFAHGRPWMLPLDRRMRGRWPAAGHGGRGGRAARRRLSEALRRFAKRGGRSITSARRGRAGSGRRASARPWPGSRTSRRFPRSLPRGRVRAMPGYMSVYSWVSPAMAALRLSPVLPIGRPVAGSPTASRNSRWPWAWPVSPSAVERNTAATSL